VATQALKAYCNEATLKLGFALLDTNHSLYLTASNLYEFASIVNIKCCYEELKKKTDEYYDFIDFGTFCEIVTGSRIPETKQ